MYRNTKVVSTTTYVYPPPPTILGEESDIYMTAAENPVTVQSTWQNITTLDTCDAHSDTYKLIAFLHVSSDVIVKLLWCIKHSNPCLDHSHTFFMSLLNAMLLDLHSSKIQRCDSINTTVLM
jgi:hypothetical protein